MSCPFRYFASQVCRSFGVATRSKYLWLNVLAEIAMYEGHVMPAYLKSPDSLDAVALETLVIRISRLADKWRTNDICPVNVWHLNLCQSITWLRLVAGSWLFVASSDNHVSKISCWDLSLVFQGYTEPIAEAYLPGQVQTAKLEVQSTGVVLALGLGANSPCVHVITLRQCSGTHRFAELCRVEGFSHVLMLQGNYIGCAVRNDAIVTHIIDWATSIEHTLPPPDRFDFPQRRY
ncbi:hypothetical protein C8R47DRAFT_422002 [Mycena vitilis]|nr:hypothetical protein C8R47DRAFT_422002 [Mycena vitilis]